MLVTQRDRLTVDNPTRIENEGKAQKTLGTLTAFQAKETPPTPRNHIQMALEPVLAQIHLTHKLKQNKNNKKKHNKIF